MLMLWFVCSDVVILSSQQSVLFTLENSFSDALTSDRRLAS